ncbi:MAG: SUMF1/EgtB/PvdO family nonheme iron enzyme [Saprospiraceae bacterium]|nr:SUMF1/EgtB/PvdO family nonheme iron enzyme [Saprospiraceae bacterium]
MPALKAAASAASVERVEKIVARKTEIRQEVRPQLQEIKTAVQEREKRRTDDVGQNVEKDNVLKERVGEQMSEKRESLTGKTETRKDKLNTKIDNLVDAAPALLGERKNALKTIADGMVFVKGGTFTMGCLDGRDKDCEKKEKPSHSVTLDDFYLSRTEVTQAQWQAIMGSNPSEFKDCPTCPVEQVSWEDVQEFLKKLNDLSSGAKYRLPTEAEWEYAARGGAKSNKGYLYAGSNDLKEVAWYEGNSGSKTHPVGQKMKNELGLYDMTGNVYEWCSDWYGDYPSAAQNNPAGPKSGSDRVLRGGSWYSDPLFCRVAYRNFVTPGNRSDSVGFRLARTK